MAEDVFTEPEDVAERWADVRMADPEAGEWTVDAVVVDGQVEYVDLGVHPGALSGFIECLVEDVDDERAREVLSTVAERRGVDPAPGPNEE